MLKTVFSKKGYSQIYYSHQRDPLEIQADILNCLLISPQIISHILGKANLNYKCCMNQLKTLMDRGCIEEFGVSNHFNLNFDNRREVHPYRKISKKAYMITDKGKIWLEKFKSLNEL